MDAIEQEIGEMFEDLVTGREVVSAQTARWLLWQFRYNKRMPTRDQRWKESTFCVGLGIAVPTRSRRGAFYGKSGKLLRAISLLQSGQYSMRNVAKIVGCSKDTVCKITKALGGVLVCKCGKALSSHRGMCKYRFRQSEKRQRLVAVWHNRAKMKRDMALPNSMLT